MTFELTSLNNGADGVIESATVIYTFADGSTKTVNKGIVGVALTEDSLRQHLTDYGNALQADIDAAAVQDAAVSQLVGLTSETNTTPVIGE